MTASSRRRAQSSACAPIVRPFFIMTLSAIVGLALAAAASADDAVNHQSLQSRPFELGVSGSSIEHIVDGNRAFCYAGTLGSLVTDGTDTYNLSNNHVLAKENEPDSGALPAVDGYQIIQPGLLDGGTCTLSLGDPANIVAELDSYVTLKFGKGRNKPANYVDAAIALTDSQTVVASGAIRDIGALTGGSEATSVGDRVHKSGRTTDHTFGEVVATGVTLNIRYDSGTARFVDQIEVVRLCDTNFSSGGDSGSLIVTLRDGAPRAGVGLLFAGGGASTFANPLGTVLADMGAEAGFALTTVHDGSGNVDDVTGNAAIPTCPVGGGGVTAADDSHNLPKKGTVLTVGAPGVLGNDSGFVGGPTVSSGPTHGTVSLAGNGGFTYSYTGSDRNGDGSDSFDYEISDATDTVTATVSIKRSKGGKPNSTSGPASAGLEHALQVRADHEDELFDIPGVLGSGVGADASGNPVIRVYVERPAQAIDNPIPSHIEGLPVRVVVTGPITAY